MSLISKKNSTALGSHIDEAKIELIKKNFCKNASNDELELFIHICKHTGLDPVMKQIWAIPRRAKTPDGKWINTITAQTSIDGLRLIADRTGNYAPGREPTYNYNDEGKLKSATSYIKKRTSDGTWHEVSASAFWEEYNPDNGGGFWDDMPHLMLAKCAEALALRKGFPAEMSGIYTKDEMDQAEVVAIPDRPEQEYIDEYFQKFGHLEESGTDLESVIKDRKNKIEFIKKALQNPSEFEKWYNTFSKEKKEKEALRDSAAT